ncbi:ATP-binding protein [Actinoplanes sp. NPDC049681]|uniref:ATP-binding protein n=1 Tax=Actinoplanes sp. NPDC049681 TaxID=3363905 RepID=UPI0037A86185
MPDRHRLSNGHLHTESDNAPPVRDFAHEDLDTLRHDVTRFAEHNGLTDPELYRFVLAVHELATNAVRHGGGHGHLKLHRAGHQLRCQISDHGPGIPYAHPPDRPARDALSGRGLWLAQHAGDLTWTSDNHGTTVTLTCPLSPPPAGGHSGRSARR